MAKASKIELTQDKLDMSGVQVTVQVSIGDWRKTVAISAVDYDVFKRWPEIYAEHVIGSIVKSIDHEVEK